MNRQEKSLFIERLKQDFSSSEAAFLVSYKGTSVSKLESLRKDLRSKGARLQVAKMRLVKRAVEGLDSEVVSPMLQEQLCLVFAPNESPDIAKVLADFAKKNESLSLVGGCLGAKGLDKDAVMALAKLPSREQLLAQVCGTLQAPISGFVSVLSQQLSRLVNVLDAIAKQKDGQSS